MVALFFCRGSRQRGQPCAAGFMARELLIEMLPMKTLLRLLFRRRLKAGPETPLLRFYLDDFNAQKPARYPDGVRF